MRQVTAGLILSGDWNYPSVLEVRSYNLIMTPPPDLLFSGSQWQSRPTTTKSLRFLVIGRLKNCCADTLCFLVIFGFFCQPVKYVDTCYWNQTKFPIHKVMVAKRGRLRINPAIWAAIGHRFKARKKRKLKMCNIKLFINCYSSMKI